MLQETLVEVTRRQRKQDELETFIAQVKDEVENLLGRELKFRARAGSADSNGCKVEWEVGASKFSVNFYVVIRPKQETELHDLGIVPGEMLKKPEGLLWAAFGELGYEQFARQESSPGIYERFFLRNRIAESDNFVALFEIPTEAILLDC
jgi:hypothetical protein